MCTAVFVQTRAAVLVPPDRFGTGLGAPSRAGTAASGEGEAESARRHGERGERPGRRRQRRRDGGPNTLLQRAACRARSPTHAWAIGEGRRKWQGRVTPEELLTAEDSPRRLAGCQPEDDRARPDCPLPGLHTCWPASWGLRSGPLPTTSASRRCRNVTPIRCRRGSTMTLWLRSGPCALCSRAPRRWPSGKG